MTANPQKEALSETSSSDVYGSRSVRKRNFWFVQIDGIGVGIASSASNYLAPFLTLLNATSEQVGLLTSMSGLTGLILAIPIGRFLQTRRNVVPWYSLARLLYLASYTLTGLLPFILSRSILVPGILVVWALATLPQVALNVCFTVVMNAVSGPEGRYHLMSWRWSILGLVSGVSAFIAGRLLDQMSFPLNYQIMFMVLSLGGIVSFFFSRQLSIPDNPQPQIIETGLETPAEHRRQTVERLTGIGRVILAEKPFVSFALKRFVYMFGMMFTVPLIPLYLVKTLNASNSWIGNIATAQTIVLTIGYFTWARISKRSGSRLVLLLCTFSSALYPALVAGTDNLQLIMAFAAFASIMQSGLDLTFFDELLKTVPTSEGATFVAVAQTMSHLANMAAPMVGVYFANQIGLPGALLIGAGIRLAGSVLFAVQKRV